MKGIYNMATVADTQCMREFKDKIIELINPLFSHDNEEVRNLCANTVHSVFKILGDLPYILSFYDKYILEKLAILVEEKNEEGCDSLLKTMVTLLEFRYLRAHD
jgi:hypothetical protein